MVFGACEENKPKTPTGYSDKIHFIQKGFEVSWYYFRFKEQKSVNHHAEFRDVEMDGNLSDAKSTVTHRPKRAPSAY